MAAIRVRYKNNDVGKFTVFRWTALDGIVTHSGSISYPELCIKHYSWKAPNRYTGKRYTTAPKSVVNAVKRAIVSKTYCPCCGYIDCGTFTRNHCIEDMYNTRALGEYHAVATTDYINNFVKVCITRCKEYYRKELGCAVTHIPPKYLQWLIKEITKECKERVYSCTGYSLVVNILDCIEPLTHDKIRMVKSLCTEHPATGLFIVTLVVT